MPNGVIGNSETAFKLADIIPLTVDAIEENLKNISSQAQTIKDAWDAKDNGNIDDMVSSIRTAINKSMESVGAVEKDVRAYAEFLERHGM